MTLIEDGKHILVQAMVRESKKLDLPLDERSEMTPNSRVISSLLSILSIDCSDR